jgi:hypothetical protein
MTFSGLPALGGRFKKADSKMGCRWPSTQWPITPTGESREVVPNLVELEEVAVPRLKPAVW